MTFNFLTGQSQMAYDPSALQSYMPLWNTGNTQGMNFANVLVGGNATPASQGIDWSVLGPWALSQTGGQGSSLYNALAQLAGGMPNQPQGGQPAGGLLGAYDRHPQLGQVSGQPSGYIGPGLNNGVRPVGTAARLALRGQGNMGY